MFEQIRTKFDTDTDNKAHGQLLPSELIFEKIQRWLQPPY